jgi:hypothetical protein
MSAWVALIGASISTGLNSNRRAIAPRTPALTTKTRQKSEGERAISSTLASARVPGDRVAASGAQQAAEMGLAPHGEPETADRRSSRHESVPVE